MGVFVKLQKLRIFVGSFVFFCLMVGFVLSITPGSPIKRVILAVLQWVRRINVPTAGAAVMFGALEIIAVILALPATPFNLTAGFMFTVWLGSLVSLVALDLAAIISFLIGRYLARSWVQAQIEKRPMFHAVDTAVGHHGFYIVLLVTLTPVFPSGLCYYLFGLSNVSFVSFVVGTCLGLFPGTVALTYVGSLMGDLTDIYKVRATEDTLQEMMWLLLAAGFTMLTIILLSLITRRALHYAILLQDDVHGSNTSSSSSTSTEMASTCIDSDEGGGAVEDACLTSHPRPATSSSSYHASHLLTSAVSAVIQANIQLTEAVSRLASRVGGCVCGTAFGVNCISSCSHRRRNKVEPPVGPTEDLPPSAATVTTVTTTAAAAAIATLV